MATTPDAETSEGHGVIMDDDVEDVAGHDEDSAEDVLLTKEGDEAFTGPSRQAEEDNTGILSADEANASGLRPGGEGAKKQEDEGGKPDVCLPS